MNILLIIVLVVSVVLGVIVAANVPISQKALNIFFLLMIVLLCLSGLGWIHV
jgi:hypothetical protein